MIDAACEEYSRSVLLSVRWPDVGWRSYDVDPDHGTYAEAVASYVRRMSERALTPEARYLTADLRAALED